MSGSARRRHGAAALAAIAPAFLAAACAGTPPPRPITDLSTHACAATLDLVTARPLRLESEGGEPATIKIDDGAACLTTKDGAKSLYAAFQLPTISEPYMLTVKSVPRDTNLFAPRLLLLDGAGTVRREIPRDKFLFRGEVLSALVRVHPDERYLVVASDPQTIGQAISRTTEATNVAVASATAGFFEIHMGSETNRYFVYSHGGTIIVSASPIPAADQPH